MKAESIYLTLPKGVRDIRNKKTDKKNCFCQHLPKNYSMCKKHIIFGFGFERQTQRYLTRYTLVVVVALKS